MAEWEVFGVIVALSAFVASVVTPIIKLNTTITKLAVIVDSLSVKIGGVVDKNDKDHELFRSQISDHELRIRFLENDAKGGE